MVEEAVTEEINQNDNMEFPDYRRGWKSSGPHTKQNYSICFHLSSGDSGAVWEATASDPDAKNII